MTTNPTLAKVFNDDYRDCKGAHTHARAEGSETSRTAFYPPEMCQAIIRSHYPKQMPPNAPALPCIPRAEADAQHRVKEQELKHVSALVGAAEGALVFDDDAAAEEKVTEICDLSALLIEAYQKEHPKASPTQCFAAVTKLLSRAEMLADPAALKAVQDEARGLEAAGTWDLNSGREYAEVKEEAKKSGISVHFGQLMSIASIKFWELAKHLQKTKGRIVYRGGLCEGRTWRGCGLPRARCEPHVGPRTECVYRIRFSSWQHMHCRRRNQGLCASLPEVQVQNLD